MQVDRNFSEFTLCYGRNPDFAKELSSIDFIMADYKVRLPIYDENLFAFKGNMVHGTNF